MKKSVWFAPTTGVKFNEKIKTKKHEFFENLELFGAYNRAFLKKVQQILKKMKTKLSDKTAKIFLPLKNSKE